MKAMVIKQYGDSSVFESMTLPKPKLKAGHLLIQVAASSVNPLDCKIRRGVYLQFDMPALLHGDVAGTVVEIGEGVEGFSIGQEVYGYAGGIPSIPGALAEFMLVDARLMAAKPQTLTLTEAAALPLVALTAWQALIDRMRISAGQKVLVHGATGGVGHIAIQIAKAVGAIVYTTVSSPEKQAIAEQLGADEVILYHDESVADYVQRCTAGAGFDAVFDTVGGANFQHCLEAAAFNGQVASIQLRTNQELATAFDKNLTIHAVFVVVPLLQNIQRAEQGMILHKLAALIDAGRIKPLIDDQRFSFDQVGLAHARAESGQAIGKVVLTR